MKKLFFGLLLLFVQLHAEEVYANFFVRAHQDATLAFHAGGIIKTLHADVAQSVKKGSLVAELANEEQKALLNVAKADVENAKVALKYAQRDYERGQKVKHLLDEARFDVYELAYERAKTALSLALANLSYKEALYNKTLLQAPFDGTIYEKNAEVGDVVTEMSPKSVFKILSKKRKLVLEFDQKYWKSVKVGQVFKYKVDGDTKEYQGVITKVYPHADAKSRKMSAEVEAGDFAIGLFGDGTIVAETTK